MDSDAARALIQRAADRGFWRLCAVYEPEATRSLPRALPRRRIVVPPGAPAPATQTVVATGLTEYANYTTTLALGGQVKSVQDDAAAAPSWLREMDLDIDRVADTHRWRHGAAETETFGGDRLAADGVAPKTGVTQLMKAASLEGGRYLPDVLKLLTDVNARDSSGWTALM